ncbi:MAG: hypothetical protein DELT_01245 [Desulfovibrio sp.]
MNAPFATVFIERRRKHVGDAVEFIPRMDLAETAEGYCLYCNIAGVRKDDISLALENGELCINAEARYSRLPGKVHALEFADTVYKAKLELPKNVDTSRISASYVNGLLKVFLPRPEKKTERIIVTAG